MQSINQFCAISSQKHHISIYLHHTDLIEKFRFELGNLKIGKSYIRFKTIDQMPKMVIHKISNKIKK